jgi:quinoprotein glucose dehydrogenase
VVTPGFQLVSLNARTGQPVPGFGQNGIVDLFKQLDLDTNLDPQGRIGNSSPPVIANDVIVVGPALTPGGRVNIENVKADIMGFDVRTGKKLWTFHTIPRPGEPGIETWLGDSAQYTGNAGIWGPFSADPELGRVYLSIESATNDVYGGHRPGNNLYSDSLVCLDIKTGKMIWYQQLVHHDIWDYDMPPAPILINLTVDGKPVRAVVQLTKQAFAYVFDRTNGTPVFGWTEKPVPQTDVPKEWTAATQPFPNKPPAFDVQGITVDDLIDFTPELRAEAIKALEGYRLGPIYTPPSQIVPNGNKGTIIVPGLGGGANWPGGAADPETGFVYVGSTTSPSAIGLNPQDRTAANATDTDYSMGGTLPNVRGLRLLKPPYGRITAYNMNRGEIAWQIPNGDTPPAVKNNPALQGLTIPKTGSPSQAGLLVTKTLLLAGEGAGGQAFFHAYDKATGAEIWQTPLPGPQTSLPMTYLHQGRQFVVVGARGGANAGAQLVAFAIPADPPAGGGRGGGRGGAGRGGAPQGGGLE